MNVVVAVLICPLADCGIQVNADFRFFNPEWMHRVNEPGESGSSYY